MTISVTDAVSGPYYPNGVTTAFPFDFSIEDGSEVRVFRINADGSEETVPPASYSVVTAADGEGGTIVMTAPPAGDGRPLWVEMDPSFEQQILFEDEGPFNSAVLNPAVDRAARRAIYLRHQLARSIKLPFGETFPGFPGAASRAGQFWGFGPDGSFQLLAGSGSATDASLVAYLIAEADAQGRPLREKLAEFVSLSDFKNDNGTRPGMGQDDSSAWRKALKSGRCVRVPLGMTTLCNIVTPPSFRIEGESSKLSVIAPFDASKPAIKVAFDGLFWSYNRTITNVLIRSRDPLEPRIGIGIAMGRAGPNDYSNTGMFPMFSGGMTVRNVAFRGLRQGFVSGAGNIGVEFYTCGFSSCYYGVYFLDNKNLAANGNLSKPGGDTSADSIMHAGNKYFYGGQFDDCDCAVYIHNETEGFGAVAMYGTIIEYNKIGFYLYTNNVQVPVSLYDCWNEGNGQTAIGTPRPNPVVVDAWAAGVRSDRAVAARTTVIEGTRVSVNYTAGFFCDVLMTATNSVIRVRDAFVEGSVGYGGGRFDVTSASSLIIIDTPKTNGGIGVWPNVVVQGMVHTEKSGGPEEPATGHNPTFAGCRHFGVTPRLNKQGGLGTFASGTVERMSYGYTRPRAWGGFQAYTPAISNGGRIFPKCSTFDITTTSAAEFLTDAGSAVTTGLAGWWVLTYDIRRLDGLDVHMSIGDLNTTQILTQVPTIGTEWQTVAALAYLPAGRTFFPAIQPISPGRTVFQLSAYQAVRFNTRFEAEAYIRDGIFVVTEDDVFLDASSNFSWLSGTNVTYRLGPNAFAGTYEMRGGAGTAKRWDMLDLAVRFDPVLGCEWSNAAGTLRYRAVIDTAVSGALRLLGESNLHRFDLEVDANLVGKNLQRDGQKILGARGATVAAAVQSAAAPTKAEFDALVAVVNALRDRLRVTTGHGLIAD